MLPKARRDRLLVQEVGEELVVYDQARDRAHHLNRTAALVWRHCDGQRTAADLAVLLQNEWRAPVDEQLVWLALDRLGRAHLLREPIPPPVGHARVTRRQVLQTLGVVGGITLLMPVVTSINAPVLAQTVRAGGCEGNCVSTVELQNCKCEPAKKNGCGQKGRKDCVCFPTGTPPFHCGCTCTPGCVNAGFKNPHAFPEQQVNADKHSAALEEAEKIFRQLARDFCNETCRDRPCPDRQTCSTAPDPGDPKDKPKAKLKLHQLSCRPRDQSDKKPTQWRCQASVLVCPCECA
jgi:hypothetical protein